MEFSSWSSHLRDPKDEAMSVGDDQSDGEYSVVGSKGEIGFIDFEDDKSVCTYNPNHEGPIIISVPFPFLHQKPQSVSVAETTADPITIENTTSESIDLWSIKIYACNPEDSFTLSLTEPSKPGFLSSSSLEDRVLHPHKTLTVWLSCKPKDIGLHTCIVHFDVGDENIERVVFLLAEDNISKALSSRKPYQHRRRRGGNFVVDTYVKGVRPAGTGKGLRIRLPKHSIPKDIREQLGNKQVPDALIGGLSKKNYVAYFKTLLIMEELRLEEDIRAYDIENATMKSRGRQLLILEVLGLAERRPSLVLGDSVFARLASPDGETSRVYEGVINHVEADQVCLKFADDFHHRHHDKNLYDISFMYNRLNFRRLYQAIEATEELHTNILFPSESVMRKQINASIRVPAATNLNEEQLNAVKMVLGCKGGVPYVINGPPGTGKTRTLVEVILQLYNTRKNSHILVCASSNSAADHILEKLLDQKGIKLREDDIFRLNAVSRPYDDMNPDYLQFCSVEECSFSCPPLKVLLHYRIIVTTYMSAALLRAEGVRRGNFSHIILDEAGQASEPETMVPVSNFCRNDTVIVLAGDPMQLGPVIFSPDAKRYGLGKSYLERLFECELYSEGGEGYVTTLLCNYRSHREILQLPSDLFYSGELVACHEPVQPAPWADLLPNKEFPILFTGVQAYDEREGNNPSWFNRTEASMVVKLINKLIARKVSEKSIGVISPYRQQVTKIKKALEDADITDIKIGSVEQFQGQERDVIIISTVRSTIKHDDFDRVHYLGFLRNPKRFNVSITRSRSLLVIIGNPHIICKDPYWEKLLWRCVDNNSYEGCSLPEKRYNYDNAIEQQQSYIEGKEMVERSAWQEEPWRPSGEGSEGSWFNGSGQKDQLEWTGAAEEHTQGEWSGTAKKGGHWGWTDPVEKWADGKGSDGLKQGCNTGNSDAAEKHIQGEWCGEESQGGWFIGSGQTNQSEWVDTGKKHTEKEWSGTAQKAGKWGWTDPVKKWADGSGFDGVEQGGKVGWSDGVEQHTPGERSGTVKKGAQQGWTDPVEKRAGRGGFDGAEQGSKLGWSDAEEPVNQGGMSEWSDAEEPVKQGGKSEWTDAEEPVQQGGKSGWSDAQEPVKQRTHSDRSQSSRQKSGKKANAKAHPKKPFG